MGPDEVGRPQHAAVEAEQLRRDAAGNAGAAIVGLRQFERAGLTGPQREPCGHGGHDGAHSPTPPGSDPLAQPLPA